ncbi:hypothetical protein, partial [Mastigocoleus testarum]|uniref:hypothetical protein n=1 Tax=Mastigocoleus testarum TaxID=996925 RepID=UPI001F23A581
PRSSQSQAFKKLVHKLLLLYLTYLKSAVIGIVIKIFFQKAQIIYFFEIGMVSFNCVLLNQKHLNYRT